MEGKKCTKCKEIKARTEFNKDKGQRDGLSYTCRACKAVWAKDNADYQRRYGLMRFYKLTLEQYMEMFMAQNGLCAICKQSESRTTKAGVLMPLCVDHDHACCPGPITCGNCVRALLCHGCNTGIGKAQDSAKRLRDMADYLESFDSYVDPFDNEEVTF